jgi:hypothetical protein
VARERRRQERQPDQQSKEQRQAGEREAAADRYGQIAAGRRGRTRQQEEPGERA